MIRCECIDGPALLHADEMKGEKVIDMYFLSLSLSLLLMNIKLFLHFLCEFFSASFFKNARKMRLKRNHVLDNRMTL